MASWEKVKLYWGLKLTEDEYKNIPNPSLEIMEHTCRKSFQATCIGLTAFALGLAFYKRQMCHGNLRNASCIIRKHGLVWGIGSYLAGVPLFYARCWQKGYGESDLYGWAYELRKNNHQMRIDRAEDAGFTIGLITSWLLGHGFVSGAISGVAVGVTGMAALNATVYNK